MEKKKKEKKEEEEASPTTKINSILMLNLRGKKLIVLKDKVDMAGTLKTLWLVDKYWTIAKTYKCKNSKK